MKNSIVNGYKVGDVWLHHPDGRIRIWTDHGLAYADGSSRLAEMHPILFGLIGYSYGGANGIFDLPDYRKLEEKP